MEARSETEEDAVTVRSYPFGPVQGLEINPLRAELRENEPLARVQWPCGEEAADMIRVLMVGDDALVRTGLRMILEAADDSEVVAEAGNRAEAMTAVTGPVSIASGYALR